MNAEIFSYKLQIAAMCLASSFQVLSDEPPPPSEKVQAVAEEPASAALIDDPGYQIGDVVFVMHHNSASSGNTDDVNDLELTSLTVGWLVQLEPELVVAMTIWPNDDDPKYYNNKRFPDEMVISVQLAVDAGVPFNPDGDSP